MLTRDLVASPYGIFSPVEIFLIGDWLAVSMPWLYLRSVITRRRIAVFWIRHFPILLRGLVPRLLLLRYLPSLPFVCKHGSGLDDV